MRETAASGLGREGEDQPSYLSHKSTHSKGAGKRQEGATAARRGPSGPNLGWPEPMPLALSSHAGVRLTVTGGEEDPAPSEDTGLGSASEDWDGDYSKQE